MWLAVPLLLAALPSAATDAPPNVLLVTLDTTRADRMGFLGSTRGLTPELDALARQAVVFERAYSQAPLTTVSHATILSGTYPQLHGVNDFAVALPPTVPYVPEILQARGYRTAAFVGSLILDPRGGLAPGFDRGFDTYDAGYRIRRGRDDRYESMERRAAAVVEHATAWLAKGGSGPFFLWIHLYDAHDPYDPPAPFKARYADRPYDGEVASVDAALATLFSLLRSRGIFDPTLIAVCADHGESLGEHGEQTHGVFLYEETLHVPLLLKLARGRSAGERVVTRASLVDLAPTILEAAGVPAPAAMQGESLLRWIGAAAAPDRPSYAETDYPKRAFGWSALASWRADRFLYVRAPRPELYDLVADPGSTRSLLETRAQVGDRLAQQMEAFRGRSGGAAVATGVVDPALAEKLASLGYVAAGAGSSAAGRGGVDPKDRIGVANTLHDAILAIESGDTARAVPLLERVVAGEPQIYMAQLQLGIARARLRSHAQAIAPLRKAIELQPDSVMAHYEMGLVLYETGDWKTSAAHFEIVRSRMPKWADARFSLGSVYARIDRVPDALAELRAALDLEPRHYRANLLLGRILSLQGQASAALPYLEQAVAVQPDSGEARSFLADAYEKLGRGAEAARERARARQIRRPRP